MTITCPTRTHRFQLGMLAGCWDLFHSGHRWMLDEAAKHCRKLSVLVASDEWLRRLKGREPEDSFTVRTANLLLHRVVNCVHPIEDDRERTLEYWARKEHGRLGRPDVLILSEDQLHIPDKFTTACRLCIPVLILPRGGPDVSTTKLLEQRAAT